MLIIKIEERIGSKKLYKDILVNFKYSKLLLNDKLFNHKKLKIKKVKCGLGDEDGPNEK